MVWLETKMLFQDMGRAELTMIQIVCCVGGTTSCLGDIGVFLWNNISVTGVIIPSIYMSSAMIFLEIISPGCHLSSFSCYWWLSCSRAQTFIHWSTPPTWYMSKRQSPIIQSPSSFTLHSIISPHSLAGHLNPPIIVPTLMCCQWHRPACYRLRNWQWFPSPVICFG